MKTFERRMAVTDLEVRDDPAGPVLTGYASTFNDPYDMGWYTETIDPGAFKRTLGNKPDVRLLINHDGLPLARTTSGTMTLDTDEKGLRVSATLDPTDPDVQSLIPKMKRGDLNQMSFGFRTIEDSWSADMSKRTMMALDLNDGDTSIVTYPANPGAMAAMRSGGRAVDAIASALRCLETRNATDDDIRSLLTRMQVAYGDAPTVTVEPVAAPAAVDPIETSDDDEAQRNAARLLIRKRQLQLL